jgi:hypothetical protein
LQRLILFTGLTFSPRFKKETLATLYTFLKQWRQRFILKHLFATCTLIITIWRANAGSLVFT